jgi:hypothetical protein
MKKISNNISMQDTYYQRSVAAFIIKFKSFFRSHPLLAKPGSLSSNQN